MDFRTRVLVVDDEPALRESMMELLEGEGLAVQTTSGGFEALAALQSGPLPDVILLDLMMGLMSGWELRCRLSADPRLAHIPVVLISAAGDVHEQGRRMGVSASLQKPVNFPELLRVIRAATCTTLPASQPPSAAYLQANP